MAAGPLASITHTPYYLGRSEQQQNFRKAAADRQKAILMELVKDTKLTDTWAVQHCFSFFFFGGGEFFGVMFVFLCFCWRSMVFEERCENNRSPDDSISPRDI